MSSQSAINQRFHTILKELFKEIYENFKLEIFYVITQKENNNLRYNVIENVEDIAAYKLHTKFEQKMDKPWNKYKTDKEDKYSLYWEIYVLNDFYFINNNDLHNQVIEEFFEIFLENLVEGFVDYEMFTTLNQNNDTENEVVLKHLFSCVNDPILLLNMFVDKILKMKFLPEKNEIIQLSAQMYEKRPIHGSICFVPDQTCKKLFHTPIPGTCLDLKFLPPTFRTIETNNLRGLRKLLELNTDETTMIAVNKSEKDTTESIFAGIIAYTDTIKSSLEKYPQIKFNGYLNWQLSINNTEWFSYNNGTYKICYESRENLWKRTLDPLDLDPQKTTDLLEIITLLSKESHGTSVIFIDKDILTSIDDKQGEVDRLNNKNRCIKIYDAEGNPSCTMNLIDYLHNIKGITSIDGAIIADLDGNIHAIGAILDGEAKKIGDVSKGARHNSVNNYLSVIKSKYTGSNMFGVIVSEDGNIEPVIPSSQA